MEKNHTPIYIYALGGLCEVGKNTYCIEKDDSLIIIDAGVRFPDSSLPGVDYVIPDYTRLKSVRQKIKALFITHGHEDHIGGIPFLVQYVHIPVIYAPKLAAALIKKKLQEMRIKEPVNIVEYNSDSIINIGDFKVSFFYVTHSIPDSYGIVVDTNEGRIVHTGDYKIDLTPVGREIELKKIARIGDEGVDLLLSDSTNAEIEGYTPSETNVLESIKEIFEAAHGRMILSTFSSNISRIQQVVQVAIENNRYIAIIGRSMENAVQIARDFGYIKIPDNRLIPISEIKSHKLDEICVLCTGSQGEPMAALSRIANDENKDMKIIPGDTVVFSSSAIPGNGVLIDKVVDQLTRKGAEVLTNSILYAVHSSGHPSKQELRLMIKLINPKYFMPIHGEYRMLKIHGQIARSLNIPQNNIFVLNNGDMIKLYRNKVTRDESFSCGPVYIDGRSFAGDNNSVINEREIMKDDGLVAISFCLDSDKKKLQFEPQVITKGFIYNDPHLIENLENITKREVERLLNNNANFSQLKAALKASAAQYIYRKTEMKPMIALAVLNKTV